MPFSTTYASQILNFTFGKVDTLTAPTALYIGLCTNNPEEKDEQGNISGVINELPNTNEAGRANGYSRKLIMQKVKNEAGKYVEQFPKSMGSATGRAIKSAAQINWDKAREDWPLVNGFLISTSPTVGETAGIVFYGKLDLTPQQVDAGGLEVPKDAVALFEAQAFGLEFMLEDYDEKNAASEA